MGLVAAFGLASSLSAQSATGRPEGSASTRVEDGERILTHARELRETLTTRIEAANSRSDLVMVDCLTPLLTQVEGNLVSAEQRFRALRALSGGGDTAAVNHESTMLSVLGQRFQLVEADMNQCLGDSDITTGDENVTVEVTVDLPEEDVTAPVDPPPFPPVPFIPPPLSPAL